MVERAARFAVESDLATVNPRQCRADVCAIADVLSSASFVRLLRPALLVSISLLIQTTTLHLQKIS